MSSIPPFQLQHLVHAALGPSGAIAQNDPNYQPRPGQLAMAEAVSEAIEKREVLVVEAGTGVGKTFAYLVPGLLSGQRVLISTATKALQDQLCQRDLPALLGLLGLPKRVGLLKGRGNYLCLLRLGQVWQRVPADNRYLLDRVHAAWNWAQATSTGDLDEFSDLDEQSPLRPWITSTHENCSGSSCPHIRDCHFYKARRQALAADVVVVNHHLFFADLALKGKADVDLLPSVDVVVMDEAHHLLEVGVQFMGADTGTRLWWDWLQEVVPAVQQRGLGVADWLQLCATLELALRHVEGALQAYPTGKKWPWPPRELALSRALWTDLADAVSQQAVVLSHALNKALDSPVLQALGGRGLTLCDHWRVCTEWPTEDESNDNNATVASWWEPGTHPRWTRAPLTLPALTGMGGAQQGDAGAAPKAWVLTSATLAVGGSFDAFTQPLGLETARTLQVPSPFDYAYQAALYVPLNLPLPDSSDHARALAQAIWPWALALGGRTLVLTTTVRAMELISAALSSLAARDLGPEVISPEKGLSKQAMLDRFRRASQPGGAGAVMVASYSFWEGVDLPGDCLQMVVIDKLPFPPPDDPWVQAQSRRATQEGRSAFKTYHLPEAALALKQGAGRLIRSETDHGLLVVGDVRLRQRGYGKALMRSLPPMRVLESELDVQATLTELATMASTKDLPWT